MSVLMSKDKKELIVTCDCKCGQSFSICIDDDWKDEDYYAFLCFLKSNYDTEYDRMSIKNRQKPANTRKNPAGTGRVLNCWGIIPREGRAPW